MFKAVEAAPPVWSMMDTMLADVPERREEGRAVEERREHPEEDELRLEVELGHAREHTEHEPADHEDGDDRGDEDPPASADGVS